MYEHSGAKFSINKPVSGIFPPPDWCPGVPGPGVRCSMLCLDFCCVDCCLSCSADRCYAVLYM